MIRAHAFALALVLGSTLPAIAQDASTPVAPSLKQNVVVTDDVVRIGDLVANAGDAADIAVFRAPDLGTTGQVPVSQVVEAVRAHDVFAIDTGGLTEISVTRASRPIDMADITTRIAGAIAARYRVSAADLAITFDRDVPVIQAEPGLDARMIVTRLTFDPRSGRFDVTLELPGSKIVGHGGLRLTGVAQETQVAAVLKRAVPRGEILRESDIAIERRPRNDSAADTVTELRAAVGLAVRHQMRAGEALRKSDLAKPELVARGQPVMLIFEGAGMKLSMRAVAKENGTQGDVVNVTNLQSKRTVQGIVTGPSEITVSAGAPHATNLASARHQTGNRRNVQ